MQETRAKSTRPESVLRKIAQGLVAYKDHLVSEIKCLEVNAGIADLKIDLKETKKAINAVMLLLFDSIRNQTLYTEEDIYATISPYLIEKIHLQTNVDMSDILADIKRLQEQEEDDSGDVSESDNEHLYSNDEYQSDCSDEYDNKEQDSDYHDDVYDDYQSCGDEYHEDDQGCCE